MICIKRWKCIAASALYGRVMQRYKKLLKISKIDCSFFVKYLLQNGAKYVYLKKYSSLETFLNYMANFADKI